MTTAIIFGSIMTVLATVNVFIAHTFGEEARMYNSLPSQSMMYPYYTQYPCCTQIPY